ncbi:MAG: hypothetical protein AABW82_02045 [Nanoarchaeota archaeon]
MGKKNSHVHLVLETELHNILKKEASDNNLSVNELCRQKLRNISRLTRIELRLEQIEKKLSRSNK